ncbi:MAG: DUF2332 domain-containing protein [Propionibacterium sp.]|nr:DUF2332 domain-containing protein [Propionibacterium sp.]
MRTGHFFSRAAIDEQYRWFASEVAATSPTWRRLCAWIAETPDVLEILESLPGQARQPNRFLATIRYLDGPVEPGPAFLEWVRATWAEIRDTLLSRTTQTNEPGRCSVIAPLLASLGAPVALLEIGASAGLCLQPDRYAYDYGDGPARPGAAAESAPVLTCEVEGDQPGEPASLTVAARRGLDLNPLDVSDPDTQRWLRALVWPGEHDREERLVAAMAVLADDPPRIVRADLTDDPHRLIAAHVDELRAEAPEAVPVVAHSAVLAYLERDQREHVADAIRASGARWISFEGPRVLPSIAERAGVGPEWASFLVALDGEPVGWAQSHGRRVAWTRGLR